MASSTSNYSYTNLSGYLDLYNDYPETGVELNDVNESDEPDFVSNAIIKDYQHWSFYPTKVNPSNIKHIEIRKKINYTIDSDKSTPKEIFINIFLLDTEKKRMADFLTNRGIHFKPIDSIHCFSIENGYAHKFLHIINTKNKFTRQGHKIIKQLLSETKLASLPSDDIHRELSQVRSSTTLPSRVLSNSISDPANSKKKKSKCIIM